MTDSPAVQPVDDLTYEQARDELAGVVRGLEAGGLSLEQSLALWERGEKLADRCEHLLNDAQQRLDAAQRSQEANDSSSS
ncbi:MAG: exodeoxyribonuclease VII small subunit [Jiangellales bacterium]